MTFLSESELERAMVAQLAELGYTHLPPEVAAPDGSAPERASYSDTLLTRRLSEALERLNPDMPLTAREDALRKITAQEFPDLVQENRRLHKLITEGVKVEYYREDGTLQGDIAQVISWDTPSENDWLVLDQFTVIEDGVNRRPDVVVFVNGLPLGVIELKAPGSEQADLTGAFNQIQTYKKEIGSLFRLNAVLVTSDGLLARIGSLTANEERFMPWRTTDGEVVAPKSAPELETLMTGVFDRSRFLELVRDFTVFGDLDGELVKIVAGYHQFHGVKSAIRATLRALPKKATNKTRGVSENPSVYQLPSAEDHPEGDRRIGVIWHTQGSGKSLLMAFYAGQLVQHPMLQNPTIVVITDRNDLDDQLFGTFAMCKDLIRQTPLQADSREDLQEKLHRASGGVIFTTIQKFAPPPGETTIPELSDRRNIIIMADEAHRSQYGFKARIDQKTGKMAYGFAKHLRDALPNASFIGFTGTPIEATDVNTPAVFGNYIDIYDISRAVEDGATVPIYYESRLARIELPEDQKPQIDAEVDDLTEDEAEGETERLKQKWSAVEKLVGAKPRLEMIAQDLIQHFESRVDAMDGKAMIVCMSRRICVALYDEIVRLRPDWHSNDDMEGAIKVVMSGAASDSPSWQPHIGNKKRRDELAKRAKNSDDPLKLVIVRDMWLTGFDAPSMHTMYVDKPMRGHGLMQAIARVNRVFKDKPAGLVVDYIGIGQRLKTALRDYSPRDQKETGIDEKQAVEALERTLDVVRSMFHGFDYLSGLAGRPGERLKTLAAALNWILEKQQAAAEKETSDEAKKKAHRRYQDSVLALSKAYALAAASDFAKDVRDEVGFFQTVRAALVKTAISNSGGKAQRSLAVQQMIDKAIVSTEIVDILSAAGMQSPDISILSDEFLDEIQSMEKKNLALEALKKLLNDEIRSRSRTNVVETRKFSDRLSDAVARYHTNAITTVEVLKELIDLAKEIRAATKRGEEDGMSDEERAFYDALAENESAVDVMGNESLRVIALELLTQLKNNITVDWARKESARARLRVLVKRILRKHGYPPDLQSDAVQTVLQQAERLSSMWA